MIEVGIVPFAAPGEGDMLEECSSYKAELEDGNEHDRR